MNKRKSRLIAMLVSILPLIVFSFLTNTLTGVFLLTLIAYWLAPKFGVEPSFTAVRDFLGGLEIETIISVIGLFAAYFFALVTWRRQKIIELRLAAGSEIREYFQEASDYVLTLRLFASQLAEARRVAIDGTLERWRLVVLRKKFDSAMYAQERLALLGIGVHSFAGKVKPLTNSSFLAQHAISTAVAALGQLSILSQFYSPDLEGEDELVMRRLAQFNAEGLNRYLEGVDKLNLDMTTNANGVFGLFQQPILVPNLALLWSQIQAIWAIKSIPSDELH